jgi:hypothetical protein
MGRRATPKEAPREIRICKPWIISSESRPAYQQIKFAQCDIRALLRANRIALLARMVRIAHAVLPPSRIFLLCALLCAGRGAGLAKCGI